jgi:hypothetical protein
MHGYFHKDYFYVIEIIYPDVIGLKFHKNL